MGGRTHIRKQQAASKEIELFRVYHERCLSALTASTELLWKFLAKSLASVGSDI